MFSGECEINQFSAQFDGIKQVTAHYHHDMENTMHNFN